MSKQPWGRHILTGAAVAFAAVAVTLHFWKTGTSVTVVSATAAGPVQTTTVHAAASDSFQLGMLGFAAVFALAAIFYGRLSQITLPGGIGIKLTPEQKQQASQALARRTLARSSALVPQPAAPAGFGAAEKHAPAPHVLVLAEMAKAPAAADGAEVRQVASDTVTQASMASQHTTDLAETLLRLARTSPEAFRVMAQELDVPAQDWPQLMAGAVPDEVWNELADHALDQVAKA
jgi:hypothetical protein